MYTIHFGMPPELSQAFNRLANLPAVIFLDTCLIKRSWEASLFVRHFLL